jgi:hypothetical protein
MKRTYWYAAMTKDEAQHSRMTFYEAVNDDFIYQDRSDVLEGAV